MNRSIAFTAVLLALITARGEPHQSSATLPPLARQTAEQDHQRLLDLLHATSLRQGPSGDPKSPDAANFDESKVPAYSLPDSLITNDGKRVTTAKTWWKVRRPEIVEEFDREIYGRVATVTPRVNWEVLTTTKEKVEQTPVITKKLVGHVDNSTDPLVNVDIELTLTSPANVTRPVPVIMEFGLTPEALATIRKKTDEQWAT